jgi:hypothetical protein
MTYDVLARAGRARRTRRLRLLLVGTALALLIGCIGAVIAHPTQHSSAGPNPPAAGSAVSTPMASAGMQPDPGTSAPLPSDLAVAHIAGIAVPTSAQDGPQHTGDGTASGFGHDRAGAVLAAANLLLRVTPQVGPSVFRPTLRTQVTGPNAAALSEQVEAQYQQLCTTAGVTPGGPVGQLTATFAGYRIDLYSNATALLSLLSAANRPGQAPLYVAAVVQLAWVGGDWRLVAPEGGVWDRSITQVAAAQVPTFNPFAPGR